MPLYKREWGGIEKIMDLFQSLDTIYLGRTEKIEKKKVF